MCIQLNNCSIFVKQNKESMTDRMVNTTNRETMFIVNGDTSLNLQTVVDAFLKENNVETINQLDFKQACDL